jgi:hypothetical protein
MGTPKVKLKIEAHPKQLEFIQSAAIYSAAVAGIGGGKTHAGAIKALLKCATSPGIRGCVTAPTYKMLNDATLPKYNEVFSQIPGFASFSFGDAPICVCQNEAEIIFRSTDKPDNLRGMEIGFYHMDEASQSSYYAYQTLNGRLRQRINKETFFPLQGWITTSPNGLNWVYTEYGLEPKPDHTLFTWGTRDNLYMPRGYIERLLLEYKGKKGEQELEGKFLNLAGDTMFDQDTLQKILLSDCRPPLEIEDNYVYVWKPYSVGRRYIMGVDCADEGGGGANVAVVIDWQTGEECAEIYGDIAADVFVQVLDRWGRIYGNAHMGVERNGIGNYIVAKLEDLRYPSLYKDASGRTGWFTHVGNRASMLAAYKYAVDRHETIIHNELAIQEMLQFVSKPSGKWEHIEGGYDDRVFARAICWQMRDSRMLNPVRLKSGKRRTVTV